MNILLATEVIHPGGAETFVLRLSRALQQAGHNVQIFIFYKTGFNEGLYKTFAPDVPLEFAAIPAEGLVSKIDSLFFKLKIDLSLRSIFIRKSLRRKIKEKRIQVIHSHLLKSDTICLAAANDQIPVVTTIHGDYLQFYTKLHAGIAIPLLNYETRAANNLYRLAHIVCISDKQIRFFKEKFGAITKGKLSKIYNGYDGVPSIVPSSLRQSLKIPEDHFVFGMVSRGIAEKGWEPAIEAFIKMQQQDTHLVLVGESDYLDSLKAKYAVHQNIHFIGHSDKPLDWIQMMNAGLLPTTYMSESLPTVIIEYLCCGIPVIASDAGEIANMIQLNGKQAGIIIPIRNNSVSVDELSNAMKLLATNPVEYDTYRANANYCYTQFDMNKCIEAYCTVYNDAIDNLQPKTITP
ncbi:MAG: hypothetical protein BGO70_05425 [Bacteroidetes bacterium 43-93]|nr:glycosyltransferase family 4 protein [Bacteroidota bacterium]OJW96839.1 MAG: hypothetical protein BGO70_05425 [Bacteroidetes bacterium 43-93]